MISRQEHWFKEKPFVDPPTGKNLWEILQTLAQMPEGRRRGVLRPHEDAETRRLSTSVQRGRLDDALNELTRFEVELACTKPSGPLLANAWLPEVKSLTTLAASGSFLRYLNTYLYFGIRMLLHRFLEPEQVKLDDANQEANRLPWWFEVPPPLSDHFLTKAEGLPLYPSFKSEEQSALRFLDGTNELKLTCGGNVRELLELWIRKLRPDLDGPDGVALESIACGMESWARSRAEHYLTIANSPDHTTKSLRPRPVNGWGCDTPLIARIALYDLYWIAMLLRIEVSAEARVMGRQVSWLGLLRFRASLDAKADTQQDLQGVEEVLRQVFGACCDLLQNAAELAQDKQDELAAKKKGERTVPPTASEWREVFDRELDEVNRQRELRDYKPDTVIAGQHVPEGEWTTERLNRWSKRLSIGNPVPDLIGVSLSGGGIRSATFNIGVMQGLQELDLLRQVDYLSSVSGGGFAASWLVANVKRSTYWLGRLTPWNRSIDHLRKYSNYLAPRTGILSMDTWSLGALWLRNTLLIQLLALTWLLALFSCVYLARLGFQHLVKTPGIASGTVLFLLTCLAVLSLRANIEKKRFWSKRWVVLSTGVFAVWLAASMLAARVFAISVKDTIVPFWKPLDSVQWLREFFTFGAGTSVATLFTDIQPHGYRDYSRILGSLFVDWEWLLLLVATFTGLLILSRASLFRSETIPDPTKKTLRASGAVCIALLSTAVVHLCLCALVYGCRFLLVAFHYDVRSSFVMATVAPALVLLTYAISILMLIGLAGRACDAGQREWWTRYGAWILASAGLGVALPLVVFGGPWLVHWLHAHHKISWGAAASWLGTTIAGLLAGRSSRTTGEGATRTPSLQMLANIGGAVFLTGAAIGAAELLFLFIRACNTPGPGYGVVGFENMATVTLLGSLLFVLLFCGVTFAFRFDLNVFGLSELYRNRLVRCYLGATRWEPGKRDEQPFTRFDFHDDIKLSELTERTFRGPFPIVNCSMNLAGSTDLTLHTRHSASFTMTPLHCGSARKHVGFRSTTEFEGGMWLGQAVAVSGAAASPNMGYNTAPMVALLMTLFNVRLGWWFRNPRVKPPKYSLLPSSLMNLGAELLGLASERRGYVNVTDGGHFENLGIYELVRRRCQLIIACDAECDETMTFTGLANAIRLCATDFGAVIELDLASLHRGENGLSRSHSAVGMVRYSDGSVGRIIYIKASITGDEDATLTQYLSGHPTFPHETTANQFFKEEQFESYRRLGQHIVRNVLRSVAQRESLIAVAERLMDTMTPSASSTDKFLQHTRKLEQVWQHFRESHPKQLQRNGFLMELMGHSMCAVPRVDADITCIGLELLQLMENIFIDLRLDDFWEHPDHRGWALLFMGWARSPRFRMVWQGNRHTFGIRFEHFCASRLGLLRDDPVLRVSPLTRD